MKRHLLDIPHCGVQGVLSIYFLETEEGLALVDCGPESVHDLLCEQIEALGFDLREVKRLFLSHVHLDHAGGAWRWAERGVQVHVHEKGASVLCAPERLMASATRIFGEKMETLWGRMEAIDPESCEVVREGEFYTLGSLRMQAWEVRGHASHHVVWLGEDRSTAEKTLFCGDMAGVALEKAEEAEEAARKVGRVVVPACPPPEVEVEAWRAALQWMLSLEADVWALAHFGWCENPVHHGKQLDAALLRWSAEARRCLEEEEKKNRGQGEQAFVHFVRAELKAVGVSAACIQRYDWINGFAMNWQGLRRYWESRQTR